MGLRHKNNPNPLTRSALYTMFRNPLYHGVVRWNGQERPGKHEPLITKDVFDRVQRILGNEKKPKNLKFAFRGLPTCGTCGGFITAEKEFAGKRAGVLRAEESRLKNRIDQAYNDKLDGLITAEHYAEKVALWREQLAKARAELAGLEVAHDLYLNEASRILDLAQRAYDLYVAQTDNFERRKLLDDLVSKVVIKDKMALSNLKEPFETLANLASTANSGGGDQGWYPGADSNCRPAV